MPLSPGARLGAYEVAGILGAGGMGEVYRARDTRLKREVALKILPASVAADPDRLARFQREAEVLASLNHPNIAAIYEIEEAGRPGEGRALVMELVEGETLADRIARGAIPVDEALSVAKQIAEALEAAHERAIIKLARSIGSSATLKRNVFSRIFRYFKSPSRTARWAFAL